MNKSSVWESFLPKNYFVILLLALNWVGLTAQTTPTSGKNTSVTGQVISTTREPLYGVTVMIKGTQVGTTTDLNGRYALNVPQKVNNPVLVFSFIGMLKQEININNRSLINVTLKDDNKMLGEVTVVGAYGTLQKRADMTGSAFQIGSEKIESLPAKRLDVMLEGLAPGVQISPNTNAAGSTRPRYNVRIRGTASLSASSEPLWIIDGTPYYTGDRTNQIPGMSYSVSPLSFINPEDIESITVLKDASTATLYGADGANGVILVTTKQGSEGVTKFNIRAKYGVSSMDKSTKFKVLNADEYRELALESYLNVPSLDPRKYPFQDNSMNSYSTTNTNWYDEFYDQGNSIEGDLVLSGGSNKFKYFISGGYFKNEQIIKGNTQNRISGRANIFGNINRFIDVQLNQSISYNTNDFFNLDSDYFSLLPIYSPYNNDGSYRLLNTEVFDIDSNGNPIYKQRRFFNSIPEREENDLTQRTFQSNTNASLILKLFKGLKFTSQFGFDYQGSFEDSYGAQTNWTGMGSGGEPIGSSTRSHVYFANWTNINRLNYNKDFNGHEINGLLAYEIASREYRTISASGQGFANDHIKEVSYATDRNGYSSQSTKHQMSYIGSASYTYKKRYTLTLNGRIDGNSNFGKDVRWAPFGSAGAAWNVQNEPFFKKGVVNTLKFKTSFGSTGNSRLGSQEAMGVYSYSSNDNYMGTPGGSMAGAPNPSLSWETTYMSNLGVRVGLWNRIDLEVEGYINNTVNLLSQLDVSRTTGDTRVYRNMGAIRNQGIEFTLSTINLDGPVKWTTELNGATNSNKIVKLYNGISKVMGERIWKEGVSLNDYYLVRWAGVDPRDGAPLWYDKEGNITRSYNINNRVTINNSSPFLSGGMSNTLSYKNFSLNFLVVYKLGGYEFSSFARSVTSDGLNISGDNQSINQLDRWQKPGDIALSPKPYWGISTGSVMNSTRYLYSTTHVNFKNVQLSYELPEETAHRMHINGCRIYVIADNLFFWSPYNRKDRNSFIQNMSGYPTERTFSLGIDFSF